MKIAVVCAPEDARSCMALLEAFRGIRIEAVAFKVGPDWEELGFQRILEYVGLATHFIVLWSEASRGASWLPFAVGYSLGGRFHTAIFRVDPEMPVPGYLARLPLIDSVGELAAFYATERSIFLEQEERDQAKQLIYDMGLSYSVESLAGCVKEGDLKAAELFLKSGISADSRDKHGVPLVCLAARSRHRRLVGLLLERGAAVDAQSEDRGNTALMDAASSGASDIVADLLASGARPDLASKDGQTALIIAVGRGDELSAELLLKAGADPDFPDKLGFSARKYASLFRNPKIIELFAAIPEA